MSPVTPHERSMACLLLSFCAWAADEQSFLRLSRAEILLTCTLLQTIIDSKAPRRAESNVPDTNILTLIKVPHCRGRSCQAC